MAFGPSLISMIPVCPLYGKISKVARIKPRKASKTNKAPDDLSSISALTYLESIFFQRVVKKYADCGHKIILWAGNSRSPQRIMKPQNLPDSSSWNGVSSHS